MADALIGSWVLEPSLTEGFDEFVAKYATPDMAASHKNILRKTEISKKGDEWTIVQIVCTDPPKSKPTTFKLGEPFTTTFVGKEVKAKITWEGGKLKEEASTDQTNVVTYRWVEGNMMTEEICQGGLKMVSKFKRA